MSDLSAEAIMRLLAQQVPLMAQRAVGLTVTRLGTVNQTSDPTVAYVEVLVDGDVAATSVLNGTGRTLAANQRVAVLFYPPHGAIVTGVLLPGYPLEQVWESSFDVTSSTTVATDSTAWTLLTGDGVGWTDSGGDLVCEVAGLWAMDLQAVWASSGAGTHRAAALVDSGGGHAVNVSHQFAPPGGTPTTGFGLSSTGTDAADFLVGDTLTGTGRQDSGGDRNLRLVARLRLLGPSA